MICVNGKRGPRLRSRPQPQRRRRAGTRRSGACPVIPNDFNKRVDPVADGVNTIKIGDDNVEYSYGPARTRVKVGTVGAPHSGGRRSRQGVARS